MKTFDLSFMMDLYRNEIMISGTRRKKAYVGWFVAIAILAILVLLSNGGEINGYMFIPAFAWIMWLIIVILGAGNHSIALPVPSPAVNKLLHQFMVHHGEKIRAWDRMLYSVMQHPVQSLSFHYTRERSLHVVFKDWHTYFSHRPNLANSKPRLQVIFYENKLRVDVYIYEDEPPISTLNYNYDA